MKTSILVLTIACGLMTTTASAQENVKRAFEKFVASKNVEVQKTFSEEHDFTKPGNPLVGKADIYTFTLKAKQLKLIDEVLAAFEKDRDNENVYSVLTHTGGHGVPLNTRLLLVGEDQKNGITIGQDEMESWQLICLLDPADTSRTHRYAYAIAWNNDPKARQLSGKIRGKLVVTYSRIPQTVIDSYRPHNYSASLAPIRPTSDDITEEITRSIMKGNVDDLLNNKAQFLAVYEAMKTDLVNANTINTRTGVTIAQGIYTIIDSYAPVLKKDEQLRLKLIRDLKDIIRQCDNTTDIGRSQKGYLRLAIGKLEKE